jgi:hypothetical protein
MGKYSARTFSAGLLALLLIAPPAYGFRTDRGSKQSYSPRLEQQMGPGSGCHAAAIEGYKSPPAAR